jgi:nitrite reductase/ring-hydroxylating ferredoxin subunit
MATWIDAGPRAALEQKGRRVLKAGGKQILLIADGGRIFACNNRCPHEGYPLSEGTLGPACTLTCNWHNWKFDLANGETLVGGDRLRQYPIEMRDGRIWIDVSDPPGELRRARALANLAEASDDDDYERMAREVARFLRAGGDPLEPLRRMIDRSAARFEYGMTHAYAAAPDWLALYEAAATEAQWLTALVEPIAHISRDTLREADYPYTADAAAWDVEAFVACIEAEDEAGAVARLNGALAGGGAPLADVRRALARAALAHYQDFGHSAIYVRKAFELIDRLGGSVAPPVLRALTRSLVYATREDKIPEFRHYAKVLAAWPAVPGPAAKPEDFLGLSVNAALERVLTLPGNNEAKYRLLLEACALAMLRFDTTVDVHTTKPVSHNVGWLDFTHTLTFGNAARHLCREQPALWPQALLQLACFLGRNAPFLQEEADEAWHVGDPQQFFARERTALYDHGIREPIFACHRVKVLAAVAEEVTWAGDSSLSHTVLAATNRYLNTPIKGHHALRAAHQALSFIEAEG